jgi:hypothetical protein
MAMRKFDWVHAYNRGGQRSGKYFNVGINETDGTLFNPNGYNELELRHALKRAMEREVSSEDKRRVWTNDTRS